jgi:hypothetical protein
MQTTLRIDDALYRKAKARAASLGISFYAAFRGGTSCEGCGKDHRLVTVGGFGYRFPPRAGT